MFPLFGRSVTLFELLGFKVQIDMSWIFLALLVTWSLAKGLFPSLFEGLPAPTYWWMGLAGALGLFASLIFHELCHSIVARRYGIPIKGITLFIFGGVAQMDDEPPSAKAEFLMAMAGPIASILLAVGFYGVVQVGTSYRMPIPVVGVATYLSFVNGLLAAFNLIPAFPLDGGRMLRAALWRWKNDMRWATGLASRIGSGFGFLLVGLGLLNVITGNFVLGIWWFLIGLFLHTAAKASYFQLLTRRTFEGELVRRFMTPNPVTVSPDLLVGVFVEDYIYKYLHEVFPVAKNSHLIGYISAKQVRSIPHEEWRRRTVGDLVTPCSAQNTIGADTDAVQALSIMNRTGNSRLLVTEGDRLVGVIVMKDMLKFLSLKLDLEAGESR